MRNFNTATAVKNVFADRNDRANVVAVEMCGIQLPQPTRLYTRPALELSVRLRGLKTGMQPGLQAAVRGSDTSSEPASHAGWCLPRQALSRASAIA